MVIENAQHFLFVEGIVGLYDEKVVIRFWQNTLELAKESKNIFSTLEVHHVPRTIWVKVSFPGAHTEEKIRVNNISNSWNNSIKPETDI